MVRRLVRLTQYLWHYARDRFRSLWWAPDPGERRWWRFWLLLVVLSLAAALGLGQWLGSTAVHTLPNPFDPQPLEFTAPQLLLLGRGLLLALVLVTYGAYRLLGPAGSEWRSLADRAPFGLLRSLAANGPLGRLFTVFLGGLLGVGSILGGTLGLMLQSWLLVLLLLLSLFGWAGLLLWLDPAGCPPDAAKLTVGAAATLAKKPHLVVTAGVAVSGFLGIGLKAGVDYRIHKENLAFNKESLAFNEKNLAFNEKNLAFQTKQHEDNLQLEKDKLQKLDGAGKKKGPFWPF